MARFNTMDESGKISETDLPEPQRRSYSAEETLLRRYRLISTFISFISVYAFIHKILIPLGLKLTPLSESPYANLDFWVVHPIIFGLWLRKNHSNNARSSFFSGLAIIYGVTEWYFVARGYYGGWLALSRVLSSTPLAIGAGYLMCIRGLKPNFRMAWLGVLFYGTFLLCGMFFAAPTPIQNTTKFTAKKYSPAQESPICGAQEITLMADKPLVPSNTISINSCGFDSVALNLSDTPLEIENTLPSLVNLHLSIYRNGKLESKWNIPLKPNTKITPPKFQLEANEVGILYSDLNPNIGVIAFLNPNRTHHFRITRKPLQVGVIDGF